MKLPLAFAVCVLGFVQICNLEKKISTCALLIVVNVPVLGSTW